MPLAGPVLATLGILTFLGSWNSFIYPLVMAQEPEMYTLPVALATFATGQYQADHGMLMAGSLVLDPARPHHLRGAPALDHRRHRDDGSQRLTVRRGPSDPPHTEVSIMRQRRLHPLIGVLSALVIAAAAFPAAAAGASSGLSAAQRATLRGYAEHTWASFVAMTDEETGLPADSLAADGTPSVQTSTTNIGAYMWSTVVAERLGFIDHDEAVARLETTLGTLETMERHEPSGQYYNWYDHTTGEKLTVWPSSGDPLTPILSSVDNGWLATGLQVVANAVPELSTRAGALFDSMDFGFYYRPEVNRIAFHVAPEHRRIAVLLRHDRQREPDRELHRHREGRAAGEGVLRRLADVPGDVRLELAGDQAGRRSRQTYLGVSVFEGAYPYEDFRVVPGWGGSMFEALMPPCSSPRRSGARSSWAVNHPLTVAAQIHHGLVEAEYGYWGFSPANIPEGGYTEYGVDAHRHEP